MTHQIGRPPHPDVLTPAEWRVLEQLRDGRPNAEIAVRLGISVNTVRYHVSNMLAKLQVPDRQALAAWDGSPRRRFGWLPPLPPIAWGLGSFGRGTALVGTAATAAVLISIVLALGEQEQEPLTSVVLQLSTGDLIGLDPATGAPLATLSAEELGSLSPNMFDLAGNLIWFGSSLSDRDSDGHRGRQVTVFDGSRLGLAPSGLPADGNGVIRRWTLPDPGEFGASFPFGITTTGDGRVAYTFRTLSFARGHELWKFDVEHDRMTRLTTALEPGTLHIGATGRLFLLPAFGGVPDALIEIDPNDGHEIDRIEITTGVGDSPLAAAGRHLYLFQPDGGVSVVDLETMAIIDTLTLPANSPFASDWRWGKALAPDRSRLYLAGNDPETCRDEVVIDGLDRSRFPQPLNFRVIDLDTMRVLYDDPEANQLAISPDSRWLVTTLFTFDQVGSPYRIPQGDGLKVIDATTLEVVAHLEPGAALGFPVISADGRYAYARSEGPGYPTERRWEGRDAACVTVTVIDLERLEVIAKHTYDEDFGMFTRMR